MTYEEIKEKTKELVKKQGNITDEEIEKVDDELIELIYDAENDEKGELTAYITDVPIYDYTKRMISKNSEPKILRNILVDLRYELSRPAKARQKVEYNIEEEK